MTLLVPRYSLPSSVVVYLQAGKGAEASGMKHDLRTNHQRQRAEICLNFLIEGLWELNLNNLLIQDTSRPSSILTSHKKSNNFHIQYFFVGFQNITKIRNFFEKTFFDSKHPQTFPGVMWGPTQNLGPIGSAFLTITITGYDKKLP